MEHEDPNLLLKLLSSLGNFREHIGLMGTRFLEDPAQPFKDTGKQLLGGAQALDQVMRFIGDNPRDFLPIESEIKAATEDFPQALAEGNIPAAAFSLLAGVIPGVPAGLKRVKAAKLEGKAIRELFSGPMKAAQEAGDVGAQTSLLRQIIEARKTPGGFTALADELRPIAMDQASRMARAAEQGFNTRVFHGTSVRGPKLTERAAKSLSGEEFNQFNWGTHAGTVEAANDRLLQLRSTSSPSLPLLGGGTLGDDVVGEAFKEGERILPLRIRGEYVEVPDLGSNWGPDSIVRELRITSDESDLLFSGKELITPSEAEHMFDGLQRNSKRVVGGHAEGEFVNVEEAQQRVTDFLTDRGFAGLKYENLAEDAGSISYMVFDPSNIRSEFAAFNPSNIGKPLLTGGLAGLLGASVANQTSPQGSP